MFNVVLIHISMHVLYAFVNHHHSRWSQFATTCTISFEAGWNRIRFSITSIGTTDFLPGTSFFLNGRSVSGRTSLTIPFQTKSAPIFAATSRMTASETWSNFSA